MFPCENEELTPSHFVPRLSGAACVLQCGGIWIGGKGWGVTWKLVQAVVKPKEIMSVFGKCHIKLSDEELSAIEKNDDAADDEPSATATATAAISTHVEDSDSEEEDEAPAPVVVAPAPKVVESKPVAAPAPVATPKAADAPVTVVKKVVKKVTAAK
jgi:hypothetical protein